MFTEVNIGKIWLSDEIIELVTAHREKLIDFCKDDEERDKLINASFGTIFEDYLRKNGYKLT